MCKYCDSDPFDLTEIPDEDLIWEFVTRYELNLQSSCNLDFQKKFRGVLKEAQFVEIRDFYPIQNIIDEFKHELLVESFKKYSLEELESRLK